MSTKLGRIKTYLEELTPIKLHDALVVWSFKITRQTKIIISPLSQCPWLPNVAGKSYDPFDDVVLQDHMAI